MFVNEIELVGYLGMDPDLRYVCDGKVALVKNYLYIPKRRSLNQKECEFEHFNVVFWRAQAEKAAKCPKKTLVHILGSIHEDCYTKDGIERKNYEITVREFELVKTKTPSENAKELLKQEEERMSVSQIPVGAFNISTPEDVEKNITDKTIEDQEETKRKAIIKLNYEQRKRELAVAKQNVETEANVSELVNDESYIKKALEKYNKAKEIFEAAEKSYMQAFNIQKMEENDKDFPF